MVSVKFPSKNGRIGDLSGWRLNFDFRLITFLKKSCWVETSLSLGLLRQIKDKKYHSLLGDREKCRKTFREFVIYDDDQVYPEFAVWYERVYN